MRYRILVKIITEFEKNTKHLGLVQRMRTQEIINNSVSIASKLLKNKKDIEIQ